MPSKAKMLVWDGIIDGVNKSSTLLSRDTCEVIEQLFEAIIAGPLSASMLVCLRSYAQGERSTLHYGTLLLTPYAEWT